MSASVFEAGVPSFRAVVRQLANIPSTSMEQCVRRQASQGGRLGEILVSAGHITSAQLLEVLRLQSQWAAKASSADLMHGAFPLPMSLSLCLPCYNEAVVLKSNLDTACTVLPAFVENFEVVVVDDGSQDGTGELAAEYAESEPRVRVVSHPQNKGYGSAVASGFRAAQGDLICLNDGDGQFHLLDLPRLLVAGQAADVVIGYRHQRADARIRSLNAKCWNLLIRTLLGVRVRDLDCAFKLFPRWVIDQLEMTAAGACISAEIMAQCCRSEITIAEVPVRHFPRYHGAPTGANLKVIGKAFRELPQLLQYRRRQPIHRRRGGAVAEQSSRAA